MKTLSKHILEKLKVKKDYQVLTVESLIDALYNYGPTLVLKDVFGFKQIKLEPSKYLSKDEEIRRIAELKCDIIYIYF